MLDEESLTEQNKGLLREVEILNYENNKLIERINRLESLFQNTTIGVYKTTPFGEVIEANSPLTKMLGYDSLEDMQMHNLEDDQMIEQRDRKLFKEKIEKEGFIVGHETQWIKKNGEKIHIRESSRLTRDANGEILFYEGTVEDITERKIKEKELIESEEKHRKLIELLPNGLAIHKDSIIAYANDSLVQTLKMKDKSELVGHNIYDFLHPDYHRLAISRLLQVKNANVVLKNTEEALVATDGEIVFIDVRAFPFELNGEQHIVSLISDITERKKNENELRLSELTYRGMLNSLTEAIFIQDLDGSFIDVNKAAESVYGYEHNFFIGRYPKDLAANLDSDFTEVYEKVTKAFNGSPQKFDFWGKKADGITFQTEVFLSGGLYFGKKVVISVVHDLTDRNIAKQKLVDSEQKYRNLIDFAVGGILIGSPEGIITEANDHMCVLLAREKNDIVGKHISTDFFTESSLKKSPLKFTELKNGQTIINQRDILRPNGKTIPIEMHTKIMPDKSYQSIYHDISLRKIAEQKIIETKNEAEKLSSHKEALLKALPDILFTFNSEGVIVDFYSNSQDLILAAPKSFLNKRLEEFLPKHLVELTMNKIQRVLNSKRMAKYNYEMNINGNEMHFDTRMAYLNDQTVLAVVRDISERMHLINDLKSAKLKAEESDRLKSAFLANMSHEIRTPMNAILGFTDLLKDDVSKEEKNEYLDIIENSCNQLLLLLNDVLEISKIEAGIISKKTSSFNLKDLLNDIYFEMHGLLSKDRNVELRIKGINRLENLICISDKIKLKHIFTNLISNALKFTEEGYVEFGYTTISDTFVEFYVKDTGIGIPESEIQNIFNRFVQIDNKLSSMSGGSGLGLSICKAYSEILGGKLRVESKNEEGSTFYFSFPIISYS